MKKVISLILCVVMMGLCVFPVLAGSDNKIPTELVVGGLSYLLQTESEKALASEAVSRKGDVNFDGKVTAVDARLCLQTVASSDILSLLPSSKSADVNGDGKVTAVDARIMLQNVAGMTDIVTYAQAEKGGSLVVGPLRSSGGTPYYWQCEVDKSELNFFDRIFDESQPGVVGGPVNQYFVFTPENAGTYTINFKLANVNQTEVIDEFSCVLTVIESK
jgi:hypothetical protein